MKFYRSQYRYTLFYFLILFFLSCSQKEKEIDENLVIDPLAMDIRVTDIINSYLKDAISNAGKIDDSTTIELPKIIKEFYRLNTYKPAWSSTEKWHPMADSLFRFIENAENEGLFPDDYHFKDLRPLKDSLDADSLSRMNAVLWTRADLFLTDGFMHIVKDLKLGRLEQDSVSQNKDTVLADQFFVTTLNELLEKKEFSALIVSLQPKHKNYWELKKGIKSFVAKMDKREFTPIKFPFKRGDKADSLHFIKTLQIRLFQSKCMDSISGLPDSASLFRAIKKYQLKNDLQVDGKYGKILIGSLNSNDLEKFSRIAVTLDKFKRLPEEMPEKYIWVNIPGYNLRLIQNDTVVIESKVIVGKPETRTPLLTSEISDLVTYPTWTVPNSIIVKDYLPKLKNNPNYISKIGLKLLTYKGEEIDPTTVNWSKYSRGIPFKVMQGSGDNNSLGVIKFNFTNPYFVYLHDTNQRYLFKNSSRALSHGCVRVQEWEKLAHYIADNDSMLSSSKNSLQYSADSISYWIKQKERRRIDVVHHIPLYIRYFSCEGKNGVVKFYDDIYGEDKYLVAKYFAKK